MSKAGTLARVLGADGILNGADVSGIDAASLSYSNAASGISATTVQGAIDYLKNVAGAGSGGSQASYTRQKFTATAGQTTFTTSGYTVGYLIVFLNGVLLDISDYTAANGTTVVLGSGASVGDELVTVALDSFNIANLLRVVSANASAASGAITVDASSNVGVGANPADGAARLTVSGTSAVLLDASGSLLRFNKTAGADTGWLSNRSYGWHNGNGLALSTQTADPLRFGTNGAERINIDSSGRVTMPYQPAWGGSLSGTGSSVSVPSTPGKITSFDSPHLNRGSCWSTANSRFTAPVAGVYLVSYTVMKDAGIGQVLHVDLYKNGVTQSDFRARCNDGGNYVQATQVYSVNLSVNDYLEFYWFGGCNALSGHDSFSITLLG